MKNLILITLDGFRGDKIKVANDLYSIAKSNGVLFSNAITAAPYTFTSMHAVFTGLYPSKSGVNAYYKMFNYNPEKCKTLTTYLKEIGYFCVADVLNKSVMPNIAFDEINVHDDETNQIVIDKELIKKASQNNKFFVYIQYSHIHNEIIKNVVKKYDDFSDAYFSNRKNNEKNYEKYISDCNEYFKEIYSYLKELNLLDNTIVVLHSDHGVSLGEKKGEKGYGVYTYDYTLKVFLILLGLGLKPQVIDKQCSLVDILPTLLDLIGIKEDIRFEKIQGGSLVPMINGSEEDRIAFTEAGAFWGVYASPHEHNIFCARYKNKKIIYNKAIDKWEFYDLTNDPNEERNLADSGLKDIDEYKKLLISFFRENNISAEKLGLIDVGSLQL